jgi:hypothetical protein
MNKPTQWTTLILTALVLYTPAGASSGTTTGPDRHERGYTWTQEPVGLRLACCGRPASASFRDPFPYIDPAMRGKPSRKSAR